MVDADGTRLRPGRFLVAAVEPRTNGLRLTTRFAGGMVCTLEVFSLREASNAHTADPPLTKARTELSRLARKDALSRGEVIEVTRRGTTVLVVHRADDFLRLRQHTRRPPRPLWGSLIITGHLEASSRQINLRLRRAFRNRRAG